VDSEPKALRPEKGDGGLVLNCSVVQLRARRESGSLRSRQLRRSPTPTYGLKRLPSANPAVNTTIVQPIATHQGTKFASVRGGHTQTLTLPSRGLGLKKQNSPFTFQWPYETVANALVRLGSLYQPAPRESGVALLEIQ